MKQLKPLTFTQIRKHYLLQEEIYGFAHERGIIGIRNGIPINRYIFQNLIKLLITKK
jgi:hypothetical protein